MTDTTPRCPWSDLPPNQCDHCTPGHRPATLTHQPMTIAHPIAHQPPTARRPRRGTLPTAIKRDVPGTLHDYVTALTQATTHHEPRTILQTNPDGTHTWITQRHTTTSPPLLEQLWSAVVSNAANDAGAHAFESKPAARLDAVDVAADIDAGVTRWLNRHNLDHPADPCRALQRAAAAAGDAIYPEVKAWWIRARTVTGWDSPAWKPDNTCPLCGKRGELRIRLDVSTATCVACREAWGPDTIGLLADHIRVENLEDYADAAEAG